MGAVEYISGYDNARGAVYNIVDALDNVLGHDYNIVDADDNIVDTLDNIVKMGDFALFDYFEAYLLYKKYFYSFLFDMVCTPH